MGNGRGMAGKWSGDRRERSWIESRTRVRVARRGGAGGLEGHGGKMKHMCGEREVEQSLSHPPM